MVLISLASGFHVDSIAFDSLIDLEQGTVTPARRALVEDGILSIRGVPGVKYLRRTVFTQAQNCIPHIKDSDSVRHSVNRVSFGVRSEFLIQRDETLGHEKLCGEFEKTSFALRKTVQNVIQMLIGRLDEICGSSDFFVAPEYKSIEKMVVAGNSLEHFHVYNSNASMSIQLHTDNGLFIAFIPAICDDETAQSCGLLLRDINQDESLATFDDDGDVIVFMLGKFLFGGKRFLVV